MSRSKQKQRQMNEQSTKLTQQEKAKISTLFKTKLSAQSIKENLDKAHGIKEDYMFDMFDVHCQITASPGELIYFTIPEVEETFSKYGVWSKYIQADSTTIGQFVAANNSIIAHEFKMVKLCEDETIQSTDRMNKAQLKSWRKRLKQASKKARFKNIREGFEGLYPWTVHGPSFDL